MEYIFKQDDFITDTTPMYSDPEGNTPYKIKIETLPTFGTLEYGGVAVTVGQVLDYTTQVGDGTFKFISDPNKVEAHSSHFYFKVSDVGSENYSNTGKITFNIKRQETNPTVSDNSDNLIDITYTFQSTSFTLNFSDPEGDGAGEVTLKSLPNVPSLKLLGNDVTIGTTFKASNSSGLKFNLGDDYAVYSGSLYKFEQPLTDLVANMESQGYVLDTNTGGVLTFVSTSNSSDIVSIEGTLIPSENLCFDFTVKDNSTYKSESNVATFCLIPQGDINIKAVYVNNPPTIGDNRLLTAYNKNITFERADFIEDTTPAYSDEEGDEPYKVKILSLPSNGVLRFNGTDVILDQEILISEIGNLTYTPDSSRIDIKTVEFLFTVSDTGSKSYA